MAKQSFESFHRPKPDGGKGGYKGLTIPFSEAKDVPLFATYGTVKNAYNGAKNTTAHDGKYIYAIVYTSSNQYVYKYDKLGNLLASVLIASSSTWYGGIVYNKYRNSLIVYATIDGGGAGATIPNATYPILEMNVSTLSFTNINSYFSSLSGYGIYILNGIVFDEDGSMYINGFFNSSNPTQVLKLKASDFSFVQQSNKALTSIYLGASYPYVMLYSKKIDGLLFVNGSSNVIYIYKYYSSSNSFETNPNSQGFSYSAIDYRNFTVDYNGNLIATATMYNTSPYAFMMNYYNINFGTSNDTLIMSISRTTATYVRYPYIYVFKNFFVVGAPDEASFSNDKYFFRINNNATSVVENFSYKGGYGITLPYQMSINGFNLTNGDYNGGNYISTMLTEALNY